MAAVFVASAGGLWAAPKVPGHYGGESSLVPVAANALPQPVNPVVPGAVVAELPVDLQAEYPYQKVVKQSAAKTVIDWETFNIGEAAWIRFDQQGNSSWSALNRIQDGAPSQIFGKLSADGQVYLINQNGIFFAPGSRVDVQSLAASSLNIAEDDFLQNKLRFQAENYQDRDDFDGCGPVANHGVIHTNREGGSVFLLAPRVENSGTIEADFGQIGLAAGDDVQITFLANESRLFPFVILEAASSGWAVNYADGQMSASGGIVGMYGRIVEQEGVVRAVTAVENNGRIELQAAEKVTTGAQSLTESPITDDPTQVHQSFHLEGGEIQAAGLDTVADGIRILTHSTERILHQGKMAAPAGAVGLLAQDRVYLDAGSRIDVSGEWVTLTPGASILEVTLNSVELKNDFLQKNGLLQGKEIRIIPFMGAEEIGDVSAAFNSRTLSARQMGTGGGDIDVQALQGDIIMRQGAEIDFSGGGTVYGAGDYQTTVLVAGNHLFQYSEAEDWRSYDDLGLLSVSLPAFAEGSDAGSLELVSRGVVLNGRLAGSATAGAFQTDLRVPEARFDDYYLETRMGTRRPRGGQLTLGVLPSEESGQADDDLVLDELLIAGSLLPLPADFDAAAAHDLRAVVIDGETPYASDFTEAVFDPATGLETDVSLFRSVVSADVINQAGLSDLTVNANTLVTIASGARVSLVPGGLPINENLLYDENYRSIFQVPTLAAFGDNPAMLTLRARAVNQGGSLNVPAGHVAYYITDTITSSANSHNPVDRSVDLNDRLYLAPGARTSAAGQVLDNRSKTAPKAQKAGMIDGGGIDVFDKTHLGSEIILMAGAEMDVSAGYEIDPEGGLVTGTAGVLLLQGSTQILEADLEGFGFYDQDGGEISLHATQISIVENAAPAMGSGFSFESEIPGGENGDFTDRLTLTEDFFADSGFSHIGLTSFLDLTLAPGVNLQPSRTKLYPSEVLQAGAGGRRDELLATVAPQFMGGSRLALAAGVFISDKQESLLGNWRSDPELAHLLPKIVFPAGASASAGPRGSVSLSAVGDTTIAGGLAAPGGDITVSVDNRLTLSQGSRIDAVGTAMAAAVIQGGRYTRYDIIDGGQVTLEAYALSMETGTRINVSGSRPVASFLFGENGTPRTVTAVGSAGAVNIAVTNAMALGGRIVGEAFWEGASGGSLTLANGLIAPLQIDALPMEGFDSIALQSLTGIFFSEDLHLDIQGRLTLDAPLIEAAADRSILLCAGAVDLMNTRGKYGAEDGDEHSLKQMQQAVSALAGGTATLEMTGERFDIQGSVTLSGFASTAVESKGDLGLLDEKYIDVSAGGLGNMRWQGMLLTAGGLQLTAARIYPAMQTIAYGDEAIFTPTAFTLRSNSETISIHSSPDEFGGALFSAGGLISVEAPVIQHNGWLAAPMGQILFSADADITMEDGAFTAEVAEAAQSVHFGDQSVTSVTGEGAVDYGRLEDDNWKMPPKHQTIQSDYKLPQVFNWPDIDGAPGKSVRVRADAVEFLSGARLSADGGGTVYGYEFKPGVDGLADPIDNPDRYVVVPGITAPGSAAAVQLEGGAGLPAGTYALLPGAYGFLEGAYVVEDQGTTDTLNIAETTNEGYPLVAGKAVDADTGTRSVDFHTYSIRPTASVLQEGKFNFIESPAGAAGTVEIAGRAVLLDGGIEMAALPAFTGGTLRLSAPKIALGPAAADFQPDLALAADFFETLELEEIQLGDFGLAETLQSQEVRLYSGQLSASRIRIEAVESILLAGEGVVSLSAKDAEPSLNTFTVRYTYMPETGWGAFMPAEIHRVPDSADLAGTIQCRTAGGEFEAGFYTENDFFRWITGSATLDRAALGFESAALQNLEIAATEDRLPDHFDADGRFPFGLAEILTQDGDIVVAEGSRIESKGGVTFDGRLELQGGDIEAEWMDLKSDSIVFVPDGFSGSPDAGLYLTETLWNAFDIDAITLTAGTELVFVGDFDLRQSGALNRLTLDTPKIAALEPAALADLFAAAYNEPGEVLDGRATVVAGGQDLSLRNTSGAVPLASGTISLADADGTSAVYALTGTGEITMESAAAMEIGRGDILLDGFQMVDLNSGEALVFLGSGSLQAAFDSPQANPAMNLAAPLVSTARYSPVLTPGAGFELDSFWGLSRADNAASAAGEPAAFTVDAAAGLLRVDGGGGESGVENIGGLLEMRAASISHEGTIDMPGGQLCMEITGDIRLHPGAEIRLQGGRIESAVAEGTLGYDYAAGNLELTSSNGGIFLMADAGASTSAHIDVSAGEGQDAGAVALAAPEGGVDFAGDLRADSSGDGKGGTFQLATDALSAAALGDLGEKLSGGGFVDTIDIRTMQGNLTVAGGDILKAHAITLAAESGSLLVAGHLDASETGSAEGGQVQLYGDENLALQGLIDAGSSGGAGGQVSLYAGHIESWEGGDNFKSGIGQGELILAEGSLITVDGKAAGEGGSVHLRVYRDGSGTAPMSLDGSIEGAARVSTEAAQTYWLGDGDPTATGDVLLGELNTYLTEAPAAISSGWTPLPGRHGAPATEEYLYGLEIQSEDNLVLNRKWDLTNIRYDGAPGGLTLRTAGDLRIENALIDVPTQSVPAPSPDPEQQTPEDLIRLLFQGLGRPAALSDALYEEKSSWGFNLAAGALLDNTDLLAVQKDAGDIFLGEFNERIESTAPAMLYTENAPLRFAAGRDVHVGTVRKTDGRAINFDYGINDQGNKNQGEDVSFNFGTYAGDIAGYAGRNLQIHGNSAATMGTGGVIQTAIGDITIEVGGNLQLEIAAGSAIRTTGMQRTLARQLPESFYDVLQGYPLEEMKQFIRDNGMETFFARYYAPLEQYGEVDTVDLRDDIHDFLSIWESRSIWVADAQYYAAHNGGDIDLAVGGNLAPLNKDKIRFDEATTDLTYWDATAEFDSHEWGLVDEDIRAYLYSADYGSETTAGVVTMGGGDIIVRSGGDVQGQFGTFSEGDLRIAARGDAGGLFQVADGSGWISVNNMQSEIDNMAQSVFGMIRGDLTVQAYGELELGTVFNPTMTPEIESSADGCLTYDPGSSEGAATAARFAALNGDISISGTFPGVDPRFNWLRRYQVLPPVVEITAGGDVRFGANLALAPAAEGNLTIAAGGDVLGDAKRTIVYLSDLAPSQVFYPLDAFFGLEQDLPRQGETTPGLFSTGDLGGLMFTTHEQTDAHALTPIHLADENTLLISAEGDLGEFVLHAPKKTELYAGANIYGISLFGQNLNAADMTIVKAGGNIGLNSPKEPIQSRSKSTDTHYSRSGLIFGGCGYFLVQAGDSINLGLTQGIRTVGDTFNVGLSSYLAGEDEAKSSLFVLAGTSESLEPETILDFFSAVKAAGVESSALRQRGEIQTAEAVIQAAEEAYMNPMFPEDRPGRGDVLMTNSQISSEGPSGFEWHENELGGFDLYQDSSDLYVMAGGLIDVGLTEIPSADAVNEESNTGLFTAQGGEIRLFSVGDINVNEARAMTFRGGDIFAWSKDGNINAGRGSKTAVSASPPVKKQVGGLDTPKDPSDDVFQLVFQPPAVGSGIRAVTYDPDGILGSQAAPVAGDLSIFAPRGIIDAGEAGLKGRNVTLLATEIVNAQNIEVGGTAIGVPSFSEGSISIGNISGAGALSETTKAMENNTAMRGNEDAMAQATKEMMESLVPKWLNVKVISFLEDDESDEL